MKRAKRKRVIQFEYRDGIIEGGIYEPKLKKTPWEKIYFRVKVGKNIDLFLLTVDEASCLIACLSIALNQVLATKKK